MDNDHPNFWSSLVSICERRSFRDLIHLLSWVLGTRDFNGQLLDPHPPPVIIRPLMDRHEDMERNLVTLMIDLPGVKLENVNLALLGDELTVSGTKFTGFERGGFSLRERQFGRFARTVKVAAGITSLRNIGVMMEDGVLMITFVKMCRNQ